MKKRQWVLIRGLGREQGHWLHFKELMQAQDPQSEVIGVDLPGAGEFHRLSSPFTIEAIAEFVQAQLNHSPSDERYLVAISLGGMVAAEIVNLYPQSVKGLVLINSSARNLSPVFHRLQLEALTHFYKAFTSSSSEEREMAILDMVSNKDAGEKLVIAKEWAQIAQQRPVSFLNFAKQLAAAAFYELPTRAPQAKALILSSFGDHMVDPRCSNKISDSWEAPIEMHKTAGHELTLDDPEWVIEQIKKHFLS